MAVLETLKVAISEMRKVSFYYTNDPKTSGIRFGDPHAVYINKSTDNPTVDLYQTSGDSSDPTKLPSWRPFILEYIENITILDDNFKIAEGYESNPTSGKYDKIIAKVK